jgi:methionyl aminopeptidase
MSITYKDEQGIAGMRLACRLASEVLDYLAPFIKPGITTNQIDKLAHDYMVDVQGCVPAPLNYTGGGNKPYPKSICTSVNQQVCHGIPNDKPLKKGDIVNVDITTIKDGWHGDTSRMFLVGECSIAAKRLCALTHDAGRHWPRDPEICRRPRFFRGARILWPWHWPRLP